MHPVLLYFFDKGMEIKIIPFDVSGSIQFLYIKMEYI